MTLQQLRGVRLRRCQHDDHLSLQASQEFSPHYELVYVGATHFSDF